MTFLNSILNNSKEHNDPFKHWEYNDALTDGAIEEIIKADIPDVSNNNLTMMAQEQLMVVQQNLEKVLHLVDRQLNLDVLLQKKMQEAFPHLVKFINELQSKETS